MRAVPSSDDGEGTSECFAEWVPSRGPKRTSADLGLAKDHLSEGNRLASTIDAAAGDLPMKKSKTVRFEGLPRLDRQSDAY